MTKQLSDFKPKPPPLPIFRVGWVLAFDQTIASTGWAVVEAFENADGLISPWIGCTGMIITTPTEGQGGFYDTFIRMDEVFEQMGVLLDVYPDCEVVHEKPAEFGRRIESSMLAAAALRLACKIRYRPITMYGAQTVKKAVAGKANASKAEVKSSVKSLAPSVVNCKPNNEHTNDAIAVAMTHLRTN